MNVHNLDRIFQPRRIALLGVTSNPVSVGGTVLRNLVGAGFGGVVYPVNPDFEAVLGIQCWPDVASLPRTPDLAVVCAAAEKVPALVRQCGEAGVLGLVVISAGFREAGPEGAALEERLREERRRFEGMRIVGPNCLGLIAPALHLNASFAAGTPKPGNVAFISQSGALCTSVLDWALEQNVGFSYFVSVGNMLDVDFADLIDYFGEDEKTESIILYVESLRDARRFMTAARAFARTKPILAYKAGRFAESARAAASHTGALAAEDAVYDAAFERAGIARVYEIRDIFAGAELVARHRPPAGPRLGIVTNAGGPGVMATDALIACGGQLAELAPETIAKLDENLPPMWSRGNPVDVLGDARARRFARAAEVVLADPQVDAVLVILTPQAMTNPTGAAKAIAELAAAARKPILAAWVGGRSVREGLQILAQAGVPAYDTPEQAVRAFMTLVGYNRNLEALYETPRDLPVRLAPDRARFARGLAEAAAGGGDILTETAAKELLAAYGIPTAAAREAADAEAAVAAAREIGYPVALKVLSPDITHKTDVGGVALDLRDDDAVRRAFARVAAAARAARPDARLAGAAVQPMVRAADGLELILGAKKDPTFGAVLMAGLGGTAAEVFRDRALGLPPLNERLARRMLESLRCWPLLRGYRGRAGVDLDRLIEVLMRLSYLVAEHPEIAELDVNPLLASPAGATALDARVVLDRSLLAAPPAPYAHLALRPYPEEYVQEVTLRDGERLTLRPIKPEDEPLWRQMLASCSRETIYSRFRYFFQWSEHKAAIRYCFIDYDRELALVAETAEDDAPAAAATGGAGAGGSSGSGEAAGGAPRRRLVGVGRLVADPDHETVEYAVLVTDAWQNRGLGGVLTDACLQIAQRWGLRRIVAETTTENERMIAVFRRRGFRIDIDPDGRLVSVVKETARLA